MKNSVGVVKVGDEYKVYPVLGTKENGEYVIFPPLVVPNAEVLDCFDSELEATLWIAKRRAEVAEQELVAIKKLFASEKAAHAMTKERAKALMTVVKAFEAAI